MKGFAVAADERFDRMSNGFFTLDHNWSFSFVNREAARLLVRDPEDLIGKCVWDEFPEAVGLEFYKQYYKAVTKWVPVEFEAQYPPLCKMFYVKGYPSHRGLSVFFNEFQNSQQLVHMVLEHSPDLISYTSPDGKIQFVSAAVRHLLGYEPHELIGKLGRELWHPLDEAAVRHSNIWKHTDVDIFTCRVRHKDGYYVWMETTLKIIREEGGKIDKILAISRDVTERKLKEEAKEGTALVDRAVKTKEQLDSFIDNHIDAVIIFGKDGEVVRINDAFQAMFGWTLSDMVGKKLFDLMHIPSDRKEELAEYLRTLQSAGSFKVKETKRKRKDGTELDVSLSAFSILDTDKNFNGWSVILRDITERKKAEELYQSTAKLNVAGQFAAGIAHEIRNPITAIKGFVQLMKSGTGEKRKYFDIMLSEIKRIEMYLSELLILAKPQMIKFERKDIREIVAQVIDLLEAQAIIYNVQINTAFEPGDYHLLCDENQLKQVFINFIKNAIEAMPNGGKIYIHLVKPTKEQVLIRLIDHGCGIPKDILSKLGQPFFTTKENGTGLGFMVSKKIIEKHKGNVNIISEENVGTTIEVSLPCVE